MNILVFCIYWAGSWSSYLKMVLEINFWKADPNTVWKLWMFLWGHLRLLKNIFVNKATTCDYKCLLTFEWDRVLQFSPTCKSLGNGIVSYEEWCQGDVAFIGNVPCIGQWKRYSNCLFCSRAENILVLPLSFSSQWWIC